VLESENDKDQTKNRVRHNSQTSYSSKTWMGQKLRDYVQEYHCVDTGESRPAFKPNGLFESDTLVTNLKGFQ
jgi:hypothetical protein